MSTPLLRLFFTLSAASLVALASSAHAAPFASARGVGTGDTYIVPNGDFSSGLSGWGEFHSSGTGPFSASSGPGGVHLTTVRASGLASVQYATLWTSIAVGASGSAIPELPASGERGQKVHYGAWLYIDDTTGAGSSNTLELILNAYNGSANVQIGSLVLHPTDSSLPKKSWFFAHVEPDSTLDGRVQSNTTALTMTFKLQAPGTYYFDDIQVGDF